MTSPMSPAMIRSSHGLVPLNRPPVSSTGIGGGEGAGSTTGATTTETFVKLLPLVRTGTPGLLAQRRAPSTTTAWTT